METVFITIHDLSSEARIKYCSHSVEEILGYLPHEVRGKSCWEYFHPDEVPFAKAIHGRSVGLDKAAVFNYCRVQHKDGRWIGCECVFTIVYDVIIASTAIYQRGPKSQKRASDGAQIRRIFSSAPRDPRYHMLSHISQRFYQEPQLHTREPRAALFLNRFTKTSTIMFATNGVASILGLQPNQLAGKSFYYCIEQNCLDDAIRCLESAKANDSIAYLRFWYRDPTQEPPRLSGFSTMSNLSDDEDEDGGVSITSSGKNADSDQTTSPALFSESDATPRSRKTSTMVSNEEQAVVVSDSKPDVPLSARTAQSESQSRSSSDESAHVLKEDVFDPPSLPDRSSASTPNEEPLMSIEIEAVISCTSDGLVVVLRRARSHLPSAGHATDMSYYANGLFASPWATQPVVPPGWERTKFTTASAHIPAEDTRASGIMESIRDVAVFAWSLAGINGSLVDHAHGTPTGESLPAGGLPIWDPTADIDEKENDRWNGFSDSTHRRIEDVDPGVTKGNEVKNESKERDSSDDEILWKRVPKQPPWRRPKRRPYEEAFGSDVDGENASDEASGYNRVKSRRRKSLKEE